jgi:hypothetical protein
VGCAPGGWPATTSPTDDPALRRVFSWLDDDDDGDDDDDEVSRGATAALERG